MLDLSGLVAAGGHATGARAPLARVTTEGSDAGLHPAQTLAIYRRPVAEERAVKSEIHPDYHEINVVMTDGSTFTTRSTWGKAGDTMTLDVDPKSHPAWTGGQTRVSERGQVEKFNRRFQNFRRKK